MLVYHWQHHPIKYKHAATCRMQTARRSIEQRRFDSSYSVRVVPLLLSRPQHFANALGVLSSWPQPPIINYMLDQWRCTSDYFVPFLGLYAA